MKTQLLEDIGQSATLSLVPSDRVANSGPPKQDNDVAPAPAATPVRPRSAFGVWRQKPEQPPPPALELPPAVEPVSAADAQHVPPQPVQEEALATNATQSEPAPQGPVFDVTPPSPTTPARDPAKHEPSWFERSGRRYMLWGSCVLLGALVIQTGWWLYEQRKDAGSLALVADELKAEPQVEKAVKRRAIGAKEFTLGPDGEVQVAPAMPASPPSPLPRTTSTVPPLVMLEPDPTAEQAPAAPLPKAMHRTERERLVSTSKPARAKMERAPDRQLAREPVLQAEKTAEPESTMSATLKACREHGYHAAQCVERKCSVTKYGFVFRGE